MTATEEWRSVVGFEGNYEVSNLGRVRSLDRVIHHRQQAKVQGYEYFIDRPVKGRILSPGTTSSGHLTVVLGRGKTRGVHRLVLEAFVGRCPRGMECCHNNGDPADNRVENLRWDTRSANMMDAIRHGGWKIEERSKKAKLTREQVVDIKRRIISESPNRVCADYGISAGAIYQIRKGASWKTVKP